MAFTNSTTHYGLPQWIGTDKPTYLVDQNNAYATIDTQLYNASTDAASAVATANSAATSATTAAENAATALSTANTADGKADSAITQSELAQTAAGAAQVAAAAAQEAAAGNSITNLAPAYDSTLTYNVGDLVTAQGKLYKCIVAVTTPMDFDINYWDDITVSEAIGEGSTVDTRLDAIESTLDNIPKNYIGYFGGTLLHTINTDSSWTTTQNCWLLCKSISDGTNTYCKVYIDGVRVFYHPSGSVSNVGYITGNVVETLIPCKKNSVVRTETATVDVYSMA